MLYVYIDDIMGGLHASDLVVLNGGLPNHPVIYFLSSFIYLFSWLNKHFFSFFFFFSRPP